MIVNTTTPVQVQICPAGRHILVQNLGADEVYIGTDATVTASTGIQVAAGTFVEFDAGGSYGTVVYAVVASGKSGDVRILDL